MKPTTNTAEPSRAQLLKDTDDPKCVCLATDTVDPTRIFPTMDGDEPRSKYFLKDNEEATCAKPVTQSACRIEA